MKSKVAQGCWCVVVFLLLGGGMGAPVAGQDFNLQKLFPFKKQDPGIKRFQLTDQSSGKSLPWPTQLPGGSSAMPGDSSRYLLGEFGKNTRAFFAKSGDAITRFASDAKESLQGLESPGWQFNKPEPWWTQPHDAQALQRDLNQLFQGQPMTPAPQVVPVPRTADQMQYIPPRYRF